MILGLTLIPSKDFQDEVNAYRKRYDSHYAMIKPHLTIKSAFEIDNKDFDSVKDEIKQRIQGIPAADIQATKASSFAPTKNVIYFKVENTDALQSLFDSFNTEKFYGTAEHPFVPHFTIAQDLTSQEFEDIYGQMKLAGVDHKETINELTLLKYNHDEDKWEVVETYPLEG
ncbi:2'-5' RNA ligase family protein [Staphylococcus pettenkoferi]|uniref:2'-5' RNA ligase family protein n=1 Tax=Staphylococcus pettenkoferi TaxID=170573 RepID=UPI002276DDDE|nr:2'-5' RNA ligase family protein [Staphylococcus pettenkoferi]MCY1615575.1 2'-5' RNA ligase family protein [Staphylococcus pettenkoferi]